jgi:hypothetical protein
LLVAGLVALAASSHLRVAHPGTAVVLGTLVLICYLSDRRWALATWRLEADLPLWLVAVAYCGPLTAFLIVLIPELIRPVLERDTRPRLAAWLAGLASFAWAVVAGDALLSVLPGAHAGAFARGPAYLVAAAAMVLVNVGIVAGIVQCLMDGKAFPGRHLAAMLVPVPLAAVIACLFVLLGLPALAAFAAVSWLPGLLVHIAAPRLAPDASSLTRAQARTRYAIAIAATLGCSRHQRRVIRSACRARRWIDPTGPLREREDVARALFHQRIAQEHGGGDWMPLEACILEFADAWAELTVGGGVSHPAALARLETRDVRFSARVLRAAWQVVDDQPRHVRAGARAPVTGSLALRITRATR